jgi:hypothetical protein
MSYCSLEEAWGVNKDKCSLVDNQSNRKKKNVTFNIENENKCGAEEHFQNSYNNVELNNQSCDNYHSFDTKQTYSNNNNDNSNNNNNCSNYLNPPTPVSQKPKLNKRNTCEFAPIAFDNSNNLYGLFNNEDSQQNANIMVNDLDFNLDGNNNNVISEAEAEAEAEAESETETEEAEGEATEGFQNNLNVNSQLDRKMLLDIMDRLNTIEQQLKSSKSTNNNVHDVILFIIIGIFVLFALDSIFRLGRLTV